MSPTCSQTVDPATLDPKALAAELRTHLTRAERQLASIRPQTASHPIASGKWSIQQTIGHLIDSCNNNLQRLIRLQIQPELHLPGYPQDKWVHLQRYDLLEWSTILTLWRALNLHFAHCIEQADPTSFTHVWLHEGERLALGFILVDYIGHLDHHLRQLPGYTHAA
jgi:hypothetical protein